MEEVTRLPTVTEALERELRRIRERREIRDNMVILTQMLKRAEDRCHKIADSEQLWGYTESAALYHTLAVELNDSLGWAIRQLSQ